MSNTNTKMSKLDKEALQDELETRYGPAIAQDIMDQIKRTKTDDSAPDYMLVKACSEMVELFRGDAQAILKQIKMQPLMWGGVGSNVTSLHKRKLETEFKRVYRLYWTSMKLFYPLYNQALAAYKAKTYNPGKLRSPTEVALAA